MDLRRLAFVLVLLLCLGCTLAHAEHQCLHDTAHFQRRLHKDTHAATGAMLSQDALWRQINATEPGHVRPIPGNVTTQPRMVQLGGGVAALAGEPFAPIRVRIDTSHLYHRESFCTAPGQVRPDFLGDKVVCTAQDVFTDEMRDFLVSVVLPRVVYRVGRLLSVRRLRRALLVPAQVCGPDVQIPVAHTRIGVAGVDLLVYALAGPTSPQPAEGGNVSFQAVGNTVAWSGYCALDEDDGGRPVIARINFVPAQLRQRPEDVVLTPRIAKTSHTVTWSDDPTTLALTEAAVDWWTERYSRYVLHELCHTLGFAPLFLRRTAVASTSAVASGGRPIFSVTTPAVRRAARAFLACPTLPGADLEASGGEDTVGSHWRRLLFRDELMVGVPAPGAALSELTLAFFSSLGFYRVHDEYAEKMRWGAQAGCDFARDTCHVEEEEVGGTTASHLLSTRNAESATNDTDALNALRYWCTEPELATSHRTLQCTHDRRGVGLCNVVYPNTTDDRPRGRSLLMEGCPVVEALPNMRCTEAFSALKEGGNMMAEEILYYGPQSRCVRTQGVHRLTNATPTTTIMTQASHSNHSQPAPSPTVPTTRGTVVSSALHMHGATCLRMRCLYGVQVQIWFGSEWISCPANGSAATLPLPASSGYTGMVHCEPASVVCSSELYYAPAPVKVQRRGVSDSPVEAQESTAVSPAHVNNTAPLRVFYVTLGLQIVLLGANDKGQVVHRTRDAYDTPLTCHPAALNEAVEQDVLALLCASATAADGAAASRVIPKLAVQAVPPFVQAVLHLPEPNPRDFVFAKLSRHPGAHDGHSNDDMPFFAFSCALAIGARDTAELHQRVRRYARVLHAGVPLPHVSQLCACEGATSEGNHNGTTTFLLPDVSTCPHDARLTRGADARLLSSAELFVGDGDVVDGAISYTPELVAVADAVLCLRTVLLSPSLHVTEGANYTRSPPMSRSEVVRRLTQHADVTALAEALRTDVGHLLGLSANLITVRRVMWYTKPPPTPPPSDTMVVTSKHDGAMYWTAEVTIALPPVMVERGAESTTMTWAGVVGATRAAWVARLRGGRPLPRVNAAISSTLSEEAAVTKSGCGNADAREGTLLLNASLTLARPQTMSGNDEDSLPARARWSWQSLSHRCIGITPTNRCVTASFALVGLLLATLASVTLLGLCLCGDGTK